MSHSRRTAVLLLLPFLALGSVASEGREARTPPSVNGDYLFATTELCQTKLRTQKDIEGDVNSVTSNFAGLIGLSAGQVTVSQALGTATFSGIEISGGAVIVDGFVPGLRRRGISGVSLFVQQETTITVDGVAYDAFYGTVVTGVAKLVMLLARTNANCMERITLTAK